MQIARRRTDSNLMQTHKMKCVPLANVYMYIGECADIRADVVLEKGGAPGCMIFFGKGWAIRRSCFYRTHTRV